MLLDHVHYGADQVEGLAQRHRAGELTRRSAEHVRGDLQVGVRLAEPGNERADAGLGDQADPRPVLRGQRAVPGELVLHPGRGGARQVRHALLQAAASGGAAHTPEPA
jgi:hypothetical protein